MAGVSLKCGDCGALLKSVGEAQEHADITSHSNFAESTEAVLNLVWTTCSKPCRSKTESHLHTKRTGHTEFVDKTFETVKPNDSSGGGEAGEDIVGPDVDKNLPEDLQAMDFPTRAPHYSELEKDSRRMVNAEIDFEQGWSYIEIGITKIIKILEGKTETFDSELYMSLYTTIYTMCTQKYPRNYSKKLHKMYRKVIEDYITQTVLPSLRKKNDEYLLKELVKRWKNHKIMVRWLSNFFCYIDNYYIPRRGRPTLMEVGLRYFHEQFRKEQIDRALLKDVFDVCAENLMGQMEEYGDFESWEILHETTSYYPHKASRWIQEFSGPVYMLKSEECLKNVKETLISEAKSEECLQWLQVYFLHCCTVGNQRMVFRLVKIWRSLVLGMICTLPPREKELIFLQHCGLCPRQRRRFFAGDYLTSKALMVIVLTYQEEYH